MFVLHRTTNSAPRLPARHRVAASESLDTWAKASMLKPFDCRRYRTTAPMYRDKGCTTHTNKLFTGVPLPSSVT